MTFWSHFKEIARQGIWASLTGGWYYEPSYTIFCNTVHLYIWLLLFILPLILGFLCSSKFSFLLVSIYTGTVTILFLFLKLIVLYLHNLFDTSEPICITSKKLYKQPENLSRLLSHTTTDVEGTNEEDIEMVELKDNPDNQEENFEEPAGNRSSMSSSRRRIVRINEGLEAKSEEGENELQKKAQIAEKWEDGSNIIRRPEADLLSPALPTILPADSLELIPTSRRRSDLAEFRSQAAIVRKFSEPCLESSYRWNKTLRFRSTDNEPRVRRAKSFFDSASRIKSTRSGTFLSQRTSEECKKITRKSFPSKMNSASVFLSDGLAAKGTMSHSASTAFDGTLRRYSEEDEKRRCISSDNSSCVGIVSDTACKKPPVTRCEQSLPQDFEAASNSKLDQLETDKTLLKEIEAEKDSSVNATEFHNSNTWSPVFIPSGDIDRPSTSALHRTCDKVGTSYHPEGTSSDLKGEITKFLEDLIDRHPETLEAIESVRMNRLGLTQNSFLGSSQPSTSRLRISEQGATSVAALSDLARKDGTHLALDHEDTSQGAIHCFQDEEGNWLAYAFDSKGIGTAQPINFGKLFEAIQPEPKLSIPENPSSSTSDESDTGMACGNERSRISRFVHAHSNSSSAESDPYIAEVPSSVFHAAGAASLTRHLDRNRQVISLVNATSAHRREILPFRHSRNVSVRGGNSDGDSFFHRHSGRLMSDNQAARIPRRSGALRINRLTSRNESDMQSTIRLAFFSDTGSMASVGVTGSSQRAVSNKKTYYRLKMFSCAKFKDVKIQIDRLSVAALFDRNISLFSSLFDVVFAGLLSVLVGALLSRSLFYDFSLFAFAVVVAGAQFSLLKSVQPDAASPIHGFNWLAAYSRPTFFCMYGLILLVVDVICQHFNVQYQNVGWIWMVYNLEFLSITALVVRDLCAMLLLLLPVAFTFGLYPQVNTLVLHLMEQIEMYVFGGTACFSLISALLQLSKSIISYILLGILAYIAYNSDPIGTHNVLFAAFAAAAVSVSWLLSRWSSNPAMMALGLRSVVDFSSLPFCRDIFHCNKMETTQSSEENEDDKNGQPSLPLKDPLPSVLNAVISRRLRVDIFAGVFAFLLLFALHCSSVFKVAQPSLQMWLCILCILISIFNHYLYNQMRKAYPWKFFSKPILRAFEYSLFESVVAAKLMSFEVMHFYCLILEKNVLYPLFVISTITVNNWSLPPWFLALFAMRILRTAFCQPQMLYIPLAFSYLLLHADLSAYENIENFFPLIVYLATAIWPKVIELYQKMSFIAIYTAPWQISWGSAFHAFAQPFSLPHTALVIFQAILSSILSAPLNPFLGSSFVLMSYVRPVKFWEKDYNTKRIDHSNTRLISQINRGPMLDDSNLNAVFYEHLTRSLQTSLAGDLVLGRWSTSVLPGDCFILASYYLNCMVHIIEVGNGYVTFQVRGLEFRGTYCHQREVEAITEGVNDANGCCCCSCGPLPGLLSFNTAWLLRWLSWEIVTAKYIIDGYSITDNSALHLLQVHDLRLLLVTLYVKCIIYYALSSQKLGEWLRAPAVQTALSAIEAKPSYVDVDPAFCAANDEDFDLNQMGVSRHNFTLLYDGWIKHCMQRRSLSKTSVDNEEGNIRRISLFCFALSLVGRRALASASHNRHANAAESFLYGLHALFKGDFRITSQRDEWVFVDMDLLRNVLSPAVRMALKLHQDHFAAGDDLCDRTLLYDRINDHQPRLFISHEDDPDWRRAIIANTPSLLALRHMYDDGQNDYKIIMLNKMHLNLRVIKLNKECVRAFWAGQQQELIFLRNRNPERGSIQNARQVLSNCPISSVSSLASQAETCSVVEESRKMKLQEFFRNMINSSADQPIGYPIYVSPLTTSYVDTHPQIEKLSGPSITTEHIFQGLRSFWIFLRSHLGSNGSTNLQGVNQARSSVPCSGVQLAFDGTDRRSVPNPDLNHHLSSNVLSSISIASQHGSETDRSSAIVLENSIVTVSSDGTSKVTLCRHSGTHDDVGFNMENIPRSSPSKLYANIVDAEENRT